MAQLSLDRCNEFLAIIPSPPGRQPRIRDTWQPPQSDWMKIIFDGATFSTENKFGISVVIRDNLGLVIASCSKLLPQAYHASEVEALAAV